MRPSRRRSRRHRNLLALAKRRRAVRTRVRVLSILPRLFPDQDARRATLLAAARRFLRALAHVDDEADVWAPPRRPAPESVDAFVALAESVDNRAALRAAWAAATELRTLSEHTTPTPQPLPPHRNVFDRLRVPVAVHNATEWLRDVVAACAPAKPRRRAPRTRPAPAKVSA